VLLDLLTVYFVACINSRAFELMTINDKLNYKEDTGNRADRWKTECWEKISCMLLVTKSCEL